MKVDKADLPCSGTAGARWDRSENVLEIDSALTRRDAMAECEAKVTVNWLFNERVVATVDRALPKVRACSDDEACDATVYDVWRKRVGAPDNTVPDSVKTQAEDISVQLTIEPEDAGEPEEPGGSEEGAAKGAGGESAEAGKKAGEAGEATGAGEGSEQQGAAQGSDELSEQLAAQAGSEGYAEHAGRPGREAGTEGYALDAAQVKELGSTDCGSLPSEIVGEVPAGLGWESLLNS